MAQTPNSSAAGPGSAPPSRVLLLIGLVVALVGILGFQIMSSKPEPVQLAAVPDKAAKAKKKKPKDATAKTKAGMAGATVAADTTKKDSAAVPYQKKIFSNEYEAFEQEGPPAGASEADMQAYDFARVRFEDSRSKELADRVSRLGEGFDARPSNRFRTVQGQMAFLRLSGWVNASADRKFDRIPETAISEYLPEWYHRRFTIHFRGPFHRFSPHLFRIKPPPYWKPDTTDEGRNKPKKYHVFAYVEEPGALLLYPDEKSREGNNGWRAAEEFKGNSAFGAAYFQGLTGGKVEALVAYEFPDRGLGLVEVHARRQAPAGRGPDSLKTRRGAYLFLVKPAERKIAFLAHDFDGRFCAEDKKIRFRGALDVDGDDNPELLLGPRPTLLVHEDAEGYKYHMEDGYKCGQ
jgi:hypothetical protein